jgi:glycosyltransferase involved in cell wall biosynthesis
MRSKVLIITYYWPPAGGGGVQRWVKFVKYLRSFGWEPIVFTVLNGDYPILDDTMIQEVPDDITIIRQPIIEPYQLYKLFSFKKKSDKIDANFLSQGKKLGWKDNLAVWIRGNFFIPDARFLWVRPSAKYLLDYLQNNHVDAMISSGPPHSCHLIAHKIKAKMNIPWIVDYRDPWTQIDYFDDLKLTNIAKQRHQRLEKNVLDDCDMIVTVGKTMAEDLRTITSNTTTVITNGYDTSDRLNSAVHLDSEFTITYIGTMNDARNPHVLWKSLQVLVAENHEMMDFLRVNLVGKPESVIQTSIDQYNLSKWVSCVGYVTHGKAIEYQNSAQLLLLIINNTSNNKSILTGKIFEYIASERPIICIGPEDGDAADIIEDSNAGVIVGYEEVDKMVSLLIKYFEVYKEGRLYSQSTDFQKYSRESLTQELASVLDQISKH